MHDLPLVVWIRLDGSTPRLVRSRATARKLIDQGVHIRAYVPNGTSVAHDADRALVDLRPLRVSRDTAGND